MLSIRKLILGIVGFLFMLVPIIAIGMLWPTFLDRHPLLGGGVGVFLGLILKHYLDRAFVVLGWLPYEHPGFH